MRVSFYLTLVATLFPVFPGFAQQFSPADNLAPYIPSPQIVVERMLEMAHVKPGETVYDLGSGDGRILITAAQKFHAKAVGIEFNPELCKSTSAKVERLGLQDMVKVMHANLLRVDLSPADVVTIYLLTSSNDRLKPILEKYLHGGARVVSNDFEIRGWRAKEVSNLNIAGTKHTIYLYEILKKTH
jgi:ubiquinone/menaquinone biosynthesis C-methylase UbiE